MTEATIAGPTPVEGITADQWWQVLGAWNPGNDASRPVFDAASHLTTALQNGNGWDYYRQFYFSGTIIEAGRLVFPGMAAQSGDGRNGANDKRKLAIALLSAAIPALRAGSTAPKAVARTFTSTAPLVADLANAIERAYPGHVRGVNVALYDAAGTLVTDADILLENAVIQVKSGAGKGLTSQLAATQRATSLPVIGYGPKLGGSVVQGIQRAGGLVTRDAELLIQVVAP
jgi:hypothetical protein